MLSTWTAENLNLGPSQHGGGKSVKALGDAGARITGFRRALLAMGLEVSLALCLLCAALSPRDPTRLFARGSMHQRRRGRKLVHSPGSERESPLQFSQR